jgi:hypothetical protein
LSRKARRTHQQSAKMSNCARVEAALGYSSSLVASRNSYTLMSTQMGLSQESLASDFTMLCKSTSFLSSGLVHSSSIIPIRFFPVLACKHFTMRCLLHSPMLAKSLHLSQKVWNMWDWTLPFDGRGRTAVHPYTASLPLLSAHTSQSKNLGA